MGIDCGVRRGELLKLKYSDIDFSRNTALLRDTKNGSNRELTETSGSTKQEVYPKDVCQHLKLDTVTQTGNCKKTMKRMLDRGELLRGSFSGSYKLLPM
jgi:integrase